MVDRIQVWRGLVYPCIATIEYEEKTGSFLPYSISGELIYAVHAIHAKDKVGWNVVGKLVIVHVSARILGQGVCSTLILAIGGECGVTHARLV